MKKTLYWLKTCKYCRFKSQLPFWLLLVQGCLWAQVPCDSTANCCVSRCASDENCLCECLFISGQYLKDQEQYVEAIKRFESVCQRCKDKESQARAAIDTILRDERIWLSPEGKNAIVSSETLQILNENGRWFFVAANGKKAVVTLQLYDDVWEFHDGIYEDINQPSDGMVRVNIGTKWGFVDTTGREITAAVYDEVQPFKEGLAIVKKGAQPIVINKEGVEVFTPPYDGMNQYENGVALIWKGSLYGYIDLNFVEVVKPVYEYITHFVGNRAFAKTGKGWVVINKKGEVLHQLKRPYLYILPLLDDLSSISQSGLWVFHIDGLSGLINTNGVEVVKPYYDHIGSSFFNNRLVVSKNGKSGLLNTKGKEVLPLKYEIIRDFNEGLAIVANEEDENQAFIDTSGIEVIKIPKSHYAFGFKDGFSWINDLSRGGGYGAIDATGREIVPFGVNKYQQCGENKYLLIQQGKKGLFFVDEKTCIPPVYDEIAHPNAAWVIVMKNGKWGWVDHKGVVKIPCRYDAVTPFDESGLATVLQFGRPFRINQKEEMIWR